MSHLRAVVLGLIEARSDLTTSFDPPLIDSYDLGRAIGRWALRLP